MGYDMWLSTSHPISVLWLRPRVSRSTGRYVPEQVLGSRLRPRQVREEVPRGV